MESSTHFLVDDLGNSYPFGVDYKVPIDYAMSSVLPPQGSSFHLISEVTNTLLGQ
ncbi:hypothetical protein Angca_001677 [Angiostrongylus cantonensis]|nr:hypothetical protein Angca_000850 [Angiostrongylus cantonensis]KAE9417292.1 hypothetical protein Angca_001677 [Angiostrongylus cantonensis]